MDFIEKEMCVSGIVHLSHAMQQLIRIICRKRIEKQIAEVGEKSEKKKIEVRTDWQASRLHKSLRSLI